MESGYFPDGAEHDPSAPYNQSEPRFYMVECPECGGSGLEERDEEDAAIDTGDSPFCDTCKGEGEIKEYL